MEGLRKKDRTEEEISDDQTGGTFSPVPRGKGLAKMQTGAEEGRSEKRGRKREAIMIGANTRGFAAKSGDVLSEYGRKRRPKEKGGSQVTGEKRLKPPRK